jgi:hypothetical protein
MFTGDCKSFFCEICIYNQQQSNGNPGFSQLELPLSQRISNYTLKLTFDTALDSFSVCRHQTPFQLTNTKQAQIAQKNGRCNTNLPINSDWLLFAA